jgi:hypothetical protein
MVYSTKYFKVIMHKSLFFDNQLFNTILESTYVIEEPVDNVDINSYLTFFQNEAKEVSNFFENKEITHETIEHDKNNLNTTKLLKKRKISELHPEKIIEERKKRAINYSEKKTRTIILRKEKFNFDTSYSRLINLNQVQQFQMELNEAKQLHNIINLYNKILDENYFNSILLSEHLESKQKTYLDTNHIFQIFNSIDNEIKDDKNKVLKKVDSSDQLNLNEPKSKEMLIKEKRKINQRKRREKDEKLLQFHEKLSFVSRKLCEAAQIEPTDNLVSNINKCFTQILSENRKLEQLIDQNNLITQNDF